MKGRTAPDMNSMYTYSAQTITLSGGVLVMRGKHIALRRDCVPADEALSRLKAGEALLMTPTEVVKLRKQLVALQTEEGK